MHFFRNKSFYQRFIFFSNSAMLVGFKLGEQVFDDPGVDLMVGGGSPFNWSVSDYIHDIRIDRRKRHEMTCSSPRHPLFYTHSHLSALQNYALLFSTNFWFIFIFKNALHNLVSELCRAPFFKNIVQVFIKFTHSFVALELLTFWKKSKKNI